MVRPLQDTFGWRPLHILLILSELDGIFPVLPLRAIQHGKHFVGRESKNAFLDLTDHAFIDSVSGAEIADGAITGAVDCQDCLSVAVLFVLIVYLLADTE